MEDVKTTLAHLRQRHYFAIDLMADWASVTPQAVRNMLSNTPVRRWQAEAILNAYNQLFRTDYTPDTIHTELLPD